MAERAATPAEVPKTPGHGAQAVDLIQQGRNSEPRDVGMAAGAETSVPSDGSTERSWGYCKSGASGSAWPDND